MNQRFDTMNQRFDETTLLIGELRDRTGRLEGTLEGFLAGLRNRGRRVAEPPRGTSPTGHTTAGPPLPDMTATAAAALVQAPAPDILTTVDGAAEAAERIRNDAARDAFRELLRAAAALHLRPCRIDLGKETAFGFGPRSATRSAGSTPARASRFTAPAAPRP